MIGNQSCSSSLILPIKNLHSSFIPNQGIIKSEYSYDNDGVDIKSIEILGHRDSTSFINTGQDFKIRIIFEAFRLVETARIGASLRIKMVKDCAAKPIQLS